MKNPRNRRQLTMVTLVVALGVAVYLNWQYAKADAPQQLETGQPTAATEVLSVEDGAAQATATGDSAAEVGATSENTAEVAAEQTDVITEEVANKNYGDAQLVSADGNSAEAYFEEARLTRTKTRDEALDKLQKSLKSAKLTSTEKEELTANLTAIIDSIAAESDIESLIKAKSFSECVVFINGDKVDVAVKTKSSSLTKEQVSQIRDIVLSKVETSAKNITIVEVK
ncbi:MAG: SpoIIIAH-like family protein [Oscillospiraceae bacterium]|nr:SpoIIIAH-like family protein [Oscillospiraceae bacterium]